MRRILTFGALILSGALTALSFPVTALWPLILVGLVPLLLFLERESPVVPALAGLLWGLGYFGCLLSWLYSFFRRYGELNPALSLTILAILVAYLALYPALFASMAARWQKRYPAGSLVLLGWWWV